MNNKSIIHLDLSYCFGSSEHFLPIFEKFGALCNFKTFIAENLKTDMNDLLEEFGRSLSLNTKLEHLSLKENKMKQSNLCLFWKLLLTNQNLKTINFEKTKATDKVISHISNYIM